MGSNEEYLDNLLKSMNGGDDPNRNLTPEEIEAMFASAEDSTNYPETDQEDSAGQSVEDSKENANENTEGSPQIVDDFLEVSDTSEMTEDDIARLLDEAMDDSQKNEEEETNDLEVNEDVEEINELLRMSDNQEPVSDEVQDLITNPDENSPQKKGKKENLFKRIFSFLTDEDENPEEEKKNISSELASNSEENEKILEELDKEEKKKKKNKKKGKKDKNSIESDEHNEVEVKKEKKKKKEKIKKVKKDKEKVEENTVPEKNVSKKKVMIISIICILTAIFVLIICIFIPRNLDIKRAKNAFYQGAYKECYELLYGKKLNESQSLIFEKSEILLCMERRWEAYKNFLFMKKEREAVDSLLQAPKTYDIMKERAEELHILDELSVSYEKILSELQQKYQVSEEEARRLIYMEDSSVYLEELNEILLRNDKESMLNPGHDAERPMEDILPEEEELDDFHFIQ